MTRKISRRKFVNWIGKFFPASVLGLLTLRHRPLLAQSDTTDDRFTQRKYVLKNTSVLKIVGRVFMNGYPVLEGDKIFPYSFFVTSPGSEITFQLPDRSTFKLSPNSVMKYESHKQYAGIFNLSAGSITSVVASGVTIPYMINTKLISLKLLESVSFFQKLSPKQLFTDAMNKPISFDDKNANYLFCLCNGAVDLVSRKTNYTYWLTEADYHTTVLITEENEEVQLKKIQRLNHTDKELVDLIHTPKIQPYPTKWLEVKKTDSKEIQTTQPAPGKSVSPPKPAPDKSTLPTN